MGGILGTSWAFVRLSRPIFLGGGVALYGLGAAMAVYAGARLDLPLLVGGQIAITATQLMTQYANDYFDLDADRANATPTRWSGGSRVLPAGELPPRVALAAARVLGVAALSMVVVLGVGLSAPVVALAVLLACIALAWAYSAPPLRLLARGLGELTTALVVTVLTPLAGFSLQTGRVTALPLLACLPLACLQFAMLLAIEFPDAEGDAVAGKKTLVLRLGSRRAAQLFGVLVLAPYALVPVLVAARFPPIVVAAVGALWPLALWLSWDAARGAFRRPARWEGLALRGVLLLGITAAAELGAFVALDCGWGLGWMGG